MFPLISAGASLLGSIYSSSTSASNTQAQIQASEQQQATQNAFQERMSDTAYQRASADMKSAGLNPMMMFGSGGAASSPSGSSIQSPMPQRTSALGNLGETVSKALDAQVQQQTFQKMVEETSNLAATRAKILAETATEKKMPERVSAETDLAHAKTGATQQEVAIKGPSEQEAQGVENLGTRTLQNVGKAKYVAGAAGDVLAPVVSSATRVLGLDILKNAMKNKNNATSFRRGMDAEADLH